MQKKLTLKSGYTLNIQSGEGKLIYSPDTDVYHIGLTYSNVASNDMIIQLSTVGRELKLLHLNKLLNAINTDADLYLLLIEKHGEILQVLYVSAGCDFTSFFCGLGKVTFLKCFYCYSTFITLPGEHTLGSLADGDNLTLTM